MKRPTRGVPRVSIPDALLILAALIVTVLVSVPQPEPWQFIGYTTSATLLATAVAMHHVEGRRQRQRQVQRARRPE